MAAYDLLVFDWDGTLVDSLGRIVEAMGCAALHCGLPLRDAAQVKSIIGLALPQAIAALYPDLAEDERAVATFQRAYVEHYLVLESDPSPFYPGVRQGLAQLRQAGYPLAVATGKSRRGLDRVIGGHGCGNWFAITRCADESASKPDPLMLAQILAHCRVHPARALMVGDSVFDLQMAARAGMDAAAVGYGAQPAEVLAALGPRLLVNDFGQLVDWLVADRV